MDSGGRPSVGAPAFRKVSGSGDLWGSRRRQIGRLSSSYSLPNRSFHFSLRVALLTECLFRASDSGKTCSHLSSYTCGTVWKAEGPCSPATGGNDRMEGELAADVAGRPPCTRLSGPVQPTGFVNHAR